jgi:hypothetical protein
LICSHNSTLVACYTGYHPAELDELLELERLDELLELLLLELLRLELELLESEHSPIFK